MLPVDTKIWTHRVPGYIPDCEDEEEDSEEEEFIATSEERLEAILGTLGPKSTEAPVVEFAAVPYNQTAPSVVKLIPDQTSPFGRRPMPPSYLVRAHAPIVSKTFSGNGLLPTTSKDWAVQWCGPGMSDHGYQSLTEYQKINHFPGSTELTRKDRLWKHFKDMKQVFGADSFDFMPESYVIPDQVDQFLDCYEHTSWTWIVKPNASSQGRGIFLLRDLEDLPLDECSVVSRYVDNPLLIQGLKWDLRIYVLVTSYTPLRAYVYREGLTRFATSPYSLERSCMNDAYRHLTNYSVNKTAVNFVENQEEDSDNYGHKWSLSALNSHLKCVGVDVDLMWARIMDLIVKTLLSVEPSIAAKTRSLQVNNNCFECYGFDVLVDDQLKPWLLEVNLSPSMKADSPLDWKVKSSLLADAFNIVGISSPDRQTLASSRLRSRILQVRQATINQAESQAARRSSAPQAKTLEGPPPVSKPLGRKPVDLDRLTEEQLRMLSKALGEVKRCRKRDFVRLYPTKATSERYLPIWAYKGPRTSESSRSLAVIQAAAARLLANVMFGPPPTGLAVGDRQMSRLREDRESPEHLDQALREDHESPEHQEPREDRESPEHQEPFIPKPQMMLSLDSGTTKAPSEDNCSSSDLSDTESKEEFATTDLIRNAGEKPPLPRTLLWEGARAAAASYAARAVVHQSMPRSAPPLQPSHNRSTSTPVLPKLVPDAFQALRSRPLSGQRGSQWPQTESYQHSLHGEVMCSHVLAGCSKAKPRRGQPPNLEALTDVEIEL